MVGGMITSGRGDSICVDAAAATATEERLLTSEKLDAIIGADRSGVTTAILDNVVTTNGVEEPSAAILGVNPQQLLDSQLSLHLWYM